MNAVSSAAARYYNASQTVDVPFNQLPAAAQTVLVDVAYPMGPNLAASAPRFFADMKTGNYAAAVQELLNFFGPGQTNARLTEVAATLQNAINCKLLPANASGGAC